MDILFIIYIFALFVIFSPNFIFQYSKSNNILISVLHAIIFSIVLYVTYNSVSKKQTEGATIGTYNKNNDQSSLNVNEMTLGGVLDEPPEIDKQTDIQYSNEVVVSSPNAAEEDKLTAMPPYDYSNFRTYDYENMEKKLKMLESHKHTNHYFDLVPNFNENKHEILCAADYGTSKPCCRQPNAFIPESNQCDALKPYCTDYISGKQWGKCVATNPYPKPNLVYDGVINTPSAPSPAPQVVVKKPTGGEVPAETETKPDGTVVIKNCPALPAPAPTSKNTLTNTNQTLLQNEYLVSSNKEYFAIMQGDGNFVIYKGSGPNNNKGVVWDTSTVGEESYAIMQSDGNFVIYKGSGPDNNKGDVWATMTQTKGVKIVLEDSGVLSVYNSNNTIVWSSQQAPASKPVISQTVNLNVYENPWKQPMISSIKIYQQPTNSPKSSLTKEGDTVVYTYSSDMDSATDMFILRNSSNGKLTQYNVNIKSNVNKDASTPPPTASTPPPTASTPPPTVEKTPPSVKKCTPSTFTVAVGKGKNTIACSEDGKTWKGLGNVLFEQGYGVAWNGKMWVAVGLLGRTNGTANTIAYCETDPTDPANWWGLGTTVFTSAGRGVAWNGSMWVAVGTGQNSIAWSYDGKNWNGLGRKVLGGGGYGVACNGLTGSKSMWVATGSRGGGGGAQGGIAYSNDGKTWTNAQCKGGVEGCATKGIGSDRLTRGLIVFGSVGTTVAWNGKIWVAGGSQGANDKYKLYSPTIAWSEDGKNWFGVSNSNQLLANGCSGLAWNGNMWLATGWSYRSGAGQVNARPASNNIARSQDGKNWTIINNTLLIGSSGMAWNGSLWITGGNNEYYQSRNMLSYSEDGEKWSGLGQNQFSITCTASASKNVLPYTNNWANCQ